VVHRFQMPLGYEPSVSSLRPLWVRGGARACALASAGLLRTAIPPASSLNPPFPGAALTPACTTNFCYLVYF